MIIFRIGQGVAAVPDEATAFSHRDASYLFHPITAWLDPADGEKMIAATRAFAAAMRPFSTGASYLNFTHETDRVRDAYGDAKYARLVALKDTYDPANLFGLNQNIQPSQPAVEPILTPARSRRGGHRGAVPARGARRGAVRGRLGAGCRARRTRRPGGAHWRARHRQDPAGRGGG
jgi:Berberine and berberine like